MLPLLSLILTRVNAPGVAGLNIETLPEATALTLFLPTAISSLVYKPSTFSLSSHTLTPPIAIPSRAY
jgi:hypothetical protein